ncbi:GTP pyrophosphokinase ywaC [Kurthia zopfii]|uniref:GTP pyrophosphokinase ywaC n=1 Tax=Kurthia zopfii TaxID=1650 RepID=A0A8B4QDI3_9BACL|nr:ppGpp synthetase/RelA/SpoT-type nucleotidyltransferase [Kurthia zopfii]STX10796.1 GTP pyrophosphokinase ywaC [Kurthia zopfii]
MVKYSFESNVLEKNNINWETLIDIYNDFESYKETLEEYANLISGLLRKQDKVHTVRTRIKDSEHLIAKLIRKTLGRKNEYGNEFQFTVENYRNEITDLIGVRVIHIFKEDWLSIHNFISGNWIVKESQANIREGDNQNNYTNLGVQINSRKTGYRSVHYLIEFMPTIQKIIVEVQVRTIFEEGYGEVDHQLSYPNSNVPSVLTLNLLMLNRLAGSADEMASAVKLIKNEWANMQFSLSEKEQEIEKLKSKINSLDIKQEQKDSLVEDLDKVKTNNIWSSIKMNPTLTSKDLASALKQVNMNPALTSKDLASALKQVNMNPALTLKGLASALNLEKMNPALTAVEMKDTVSGEVSKTKKKKK